jgi:hypothetical protein
MAERATIVSRIAEIEEAIALGALRVKTGERDVTFRSLEEMRSVLSDLQGELAGIDGARRTRVLRFATRRGI